MPVRLIVNETALLYCNNVINEAIAIILLKLEANLKVLIVLRRYLTQRL